MIKIIRERIKQKNRTVAYPAARLNVPDRFRGAPVIAAGSCPSGCAVCLDACPVQALSHDSEGGLCLDMGRCLFCSECVPACPAGRISFSREYELAARRREDLVVGAAGLRPLVPLEERLRRIYGRSLKLRQISAGGCNACEADANVLTTVVFDMSRFGIEFVASPRHADGIYVTGPVPENMRIAVFKTYAAVPEPRIVIAAGACAISGGIFRGLDGNGNGLEGLIPIDLYIPGCPPHPATALDAMCRMLGRVRTPQACER